MIRKIAMIEDNTDHALLIRRALEAGDCQIHHFMSGEEALDVLGGVKMVEEVNLVTIS